MFFRQLEKLCKAVKHYVSLYSVVRTYFRISDIWNRSFIYVLETNRVQFTTRVRHECYTNDTNATRVKKVNQVKGFRVLMVRFSITSALLLASSFVSSAQSVKQQSSYSKKSSHMKMLNKRGPKKEPCGIPDLIFSHIL